MTKAEELSEDVVRTDEIIGVDVVNKGGENLGAIKDIVLDKYEGQVRYVVLSFGGILGMGDKLFALPWKAIHYDESEDSFVLDVDKERLKNAPGFDKDNWPNFSDREWGQTIFNFYGSQPYWDIKNK